MSSFLGEGNVCNVHVHMCAYMCREQVNIECLPPLLSRLYVLRLADMRLAIQLAPGSTCLHLMKKGWDYR